MSNAIYIDSCFQNVNLRHDVFRHTVNYRMLKIMSSSRMFFNYLSIMSVSAQLSHCAFACAHMSLSAYVLALLSCTLKLRRPDLQFTTKAKRYGEWLKGLCRAFLYVPA